MREREYVCILEGSQRGGGGRAVSVFSDNMNEAPLGELPV